MDNMGDIAVYQIHAVDGDGADIVFDFYSQRIAVSIFPCSSSQHSQHLDRKQPILENRLIDLSTTLSLRMSTNTKRS
jgi:hypothetical protein